MAKANGVILLSFPPHTTHKLQPLDRSVFGPFKKFTNSAIDSWMKNNPGKTMTIYDIPTIVKQALPNAITPKNVMAGFMATGIWPFNKDIFGGEGFLPSTVTDRQKTSVPPQERNFAEYTTRSSDVIAGRGSSASQADILSKESPCTSKAGPSTSLQVEVHVSPHEIRPFPKAGDRKVIRKRKSMVSAILTDSPIKNALQAEVDKRQNLKKNVSFIERKTTSRKGSKKRKRAPKEASSSEEDDDCLCIECSEPYSKSRPPTKWLQCRVCSEWAHDHCPKFDCLYICKNCNSDIDDDDSASE